MERPVDSQSRERAVNLEELGFDTWFEREFTQRAAPEGSPARVTAVDRDSYLVRNEHGEVRAELAGKLLYSAQASLDLPCVGDWVCARYYDEGAFAVIFDLLPRKSLLSRKTPGKTIDYQPIASNLDVAFLVQSCDSDFSVRRLERYLAVVHQAQIEARVLLTKSDLIPSEELDRKLAEIRLADIHCAVLTWSHLTGDGKSQLREMLEEGKTYCLLGSSGVGKTTILNELVGTEVFRTADVRGYDGKGRHTTSRRQLIVLSQGAMLIDTPGMRELGSLGVSEGIQEAFPDISRLSDGCHFNDCTHTTEIGCALLAAVARGDLSRERYDSYLRLLKESEFHEMSYLERRKKDRQFGRYVKSVMKHKK